jgi:hypothetical protein
MATQHPTLATDAEHRPRFKGNGIRQCEWRTLRFSRINMTACFHEHRYCNRREEGIDEAGSRRKSFSWRTTRSHRQLASQRLYKFVCDSGLGWLQTEGDLDMVTGNTKRSACSESISSWQQAGPCTDPHWTVTLPHWHSVKIKTFDTNTTTHRQQYRGQNQSHVRYHLLWWPSDRDGVVGSDCRLCVSEEVRESSTTIHSSWNICVYDILLLLLLLGPVLNQSIETSQTEDVSS